MQEISLGQYAIPFLITILLAFVFKPFDKSDGSSILKDWQKGYIAAILGVAIGFVAMFYKGGVVTFTTWVDYILYGFVQGTSAIGIFKLAQFTPGVPITLSKP